MQKDTSKILEEISLCSDFKKFYQDNENYMIHEDLPALLTRFMHEKNRKKSEVIRNAQLSEVYGYQIFSGLRTPERKKLLCLILSLGLNVEEAQQLLKAAGYSPLYAKLPFDSIVLYGIKNKLSVLEMNEMLYEYDFETLG